MKKWLKILSVTLLGVLMATGAFFVTKPVLTSYGILNPNNEAEPATMPALESTSVFRINYSLCVPYRRPRVLDAAEATPILERAIKRIHQRLLKARNHLPALSEIDKATPEGCGFTYRKGDVSRNDQGNRVFDPPDSCHLYLSAEYPFWESMMRPAVPNKEYSIYGDCFAYYARITAASGENEIYRIINQEMDRAAEELQTAARSKFLKAGEEIFLATRTGNAAKVEQLLARKPDLANAKDINGLAPLHWAQDKRVAELLLAKKADVNAKDKLGLTPLHWAVYNGHFDLVKLFAANGADINAKTNDGWTPTDLAEELYYKPEEITLFLLHHGGIPGLPDARLKFALKWLGEDRLKRVLQRRPDFVDMKDERGRTALHNAVSSHNREAVELLLDAGANPNIKDNFKYTPLQMLYVMDPQVLALLLAHKADPNVRDEKGRTLLDRALQQHATKIVDLLHTYGAHKGVGAIHNTIMHQDIGELKLLLSSQPETANEKDRYGNYPIHLSVKYLNLEILKLLLDHHADVNVRNKEGFTALHLGAGSKEATALLIAHGADVNAKADDRYSYTVLHMAVASRDSLSLLIAHGADVNAKANNGLTVLHRVVDSKDTMALLIAHGADVNARDQWGDTPLHLAVRRINNKEAVELLIANKADVNAEDKNGFTPLDYTFRYNSDLNWKTVIDLLQEHGGIYNRSPGFAHRKEMLRNISQGLIPPALLGLIGSTNRFFRSSPTIYNGVPLTPDQEETLRNMPDVKAALNALKEAGKTIEDVRNAKLSKAGYHFESRTDRTPDGRTAIYHRWVASNGEPLAAKQMTEINNSPEVKAAYGANTKAFKTYRAVKDAVMAKLVDQTGHGTNNTLAPIQTPSTGSVSNGTIQVKEK